MRDDSEADPDGEDIGEVEDVNGSWTSQDAAVEEG